jgi:hypothetical protein
VTPVEQYKRGVKVAIVDPIRNHPQSVSPLIPSGCWSNTVVMLRPPRLRGPLDRFGYRLSAVGKRVR